MDEPSTSPAEAPAPADRGRRSALLIVFLVVVIDLLGFGIVLPLLPRYARTFLAGDWLVTGGGDSQLAGPIIGLLLSAFSIMQFIFAPIWGRLSDRVGRKPILMLGLAGSVVFYALFGIASNIGTEQQALGLALFFVARIGQGIAGATIATAQAVIADTTPPEKRSRGMALIGAAFGIGFTFGPLLGAASLVLLPNHLGAPGFAAAGFSLLALVLGLRMLPETLRPDSNATHRRWLDWRGLQQALRTPAIGLLIVMFFLATFAFSNLEATLALATKDVLNYGDKGNFVIFAYVGFMLILAQGGLYQMLARRGVAEMTFIASGLALLILGLGGLGATGVLEHEGLLEHGPLLAMLLSCMALAVVGFAFLTPSIQSLISRRSDPTKQGEILGINQSASALSRILGPLMGLSLYNLTPSHMLPYAVATGLLVLVGFMIPLVRTAPAEPA